MEAEDTRRQTPGRRARLVCHRCHEKKIRCDLPRVGAACSNCLSASATCEFRPSRKGHHRRKPDSEARKSQVHTASSSSIEPPAAQLPPVAANGSNYLRALLGHQFGPQRPNIDRDDPDIPHKQAGDDFLPGSIRSYLETYSEICYTWCPIIDIDDSTMTTDSLLLNHSLASVSSMIRPSVMPGLYRSREHYERARQLFYAERQNSTLVLVKAALLLSYCDNSRLGNPMGGSSWWLGVAVRLAQDMRLHRAPRDATATHDARLQKRIWWTLFARERTMAMCQGRPCTIDEDDCNLGLPEVADFPENRSQEGAVFVHWIQLCRIMGRVNKHMTTARQTGVRIPTQEVATSLIAWLQGLPTGLQLSIQGTHTASLVRDIYLLYLPYLTTVAIIYLNTTGQDVPEVSVAAVLAAGCIGRIIGDLLLRNCTHALLEDSAWYLTFAITALMHVRSVPSLAAYVTADIKILRTALGQMSATWSSAKILATGLDKIMDRHRTAVTAGDECVERIDSDTTSRGPALFVARAQSLQDLCADDGVLWTDFFPFATTQTSLLVEALLTECQASYLDIWPEFDFNLDFDALWKELDVGQTGLLQNMDLYP